MVTRWSPGGHHPPDHLVDGKVERVILGGRATRTEHHQEEVIDVPEGDLSPHLYIVALFRLTQSFGTQAASSGESLKTDILPGFPW